MQYRDDILQSYSEFSPASLDVMARIGHLSHISDLDTCCATLVEEGMLERVCVGGLVQYTISPRGRAILGDRGVPPSSSRITMFRRLCNLERKHLDKRHQVLRVLSAHPRYLTIIQIKLAMPTNISIAELHSILFALLHTGQVSQCGPLFGVASSAARGVDASSE